MHFLLLIAIGLGIAGQTELPDWPPLPEEGEHVDYIKWYDDARRAGMKPEDDAFPLYRKIMPSIDDPDGKRPDQFRFSGFRHEDPVPEGYPKPWDPKEHPEWEASYQRTKAALKQFKKAAAKPYYFMPNKFGPDAKETGPLLCSVLEPMLAEFRNYGRGFSEAAWRAPGGQPSSDEFLSYLRGQFGAVRQVEREPLIVSQLVGIALRAQAYEDIRWSLRFGVHPSNALQALESELTLGDGAIPSYELAMRGMCAAAFDVLQFIQENPPSRIRKDALVSSVFAVMRKQKLSIEVCARDTCNYMQAFARTTENSVAARRTRVADLATLRRIEKSNPTVTLWFGGLDRARVLRLRVQSLQAATRLIVAMHSYRAKNNRWPKSLNELPRSVAREFQIDPLSDQPLIYRLQDGKPTLYSVGSNRKDDGGKHNRLWGEGDPESDFVFWPPQQERLFRPTKPDSKGK